jgi:hypothetical protein
MIRKSAANVIHSLTAAKRLKIEEIRRAALRAGQMGDDIHTDGGTYHIALTPDDVALLKQANDIAKMLPIPAEFFTSRTAEIKEKWPDGTTKLHPEVPEPVHDAVVFQAALLAREILLRQEELIQAVQDAETAEEVSAIHWEMEISTMEVN